MSHPTDNQQAYDAGTAAIAVVHEQLRNVISSLSDVKETLKGQAEQVAKLAVIEERNLGMARTIERAFNEIADTNKRIAEAAQAQKKQDTAIHESIERQKTFVQRWVYTVSGAVTAVSVMWALFGWYFTDTAKAAVEITQQYKYGRLPAPSPSSQLMPPSAPAQP